MGIEVTKQTAFSLLTHKGLVTTKQTAFILMLPPKPRPSRRRPTLITN